MSANERGLGRGLDALFRNVTPAERPSSGKADNAGMPAPSTPKHTTTLPIAALTPCKGQPRKHFDEAALEELAASIRSQGIIQPLLVRPRRTETATIYEIVAGERRWRAAQRAGLTEVPVYLRELSDEDALTAALIENLQREDLNPLEEAQAIQSLRERLPYSQEELAQRLGKSRSAVANSLRLLQLPRPMQEALKDGVFTPGHARAVLALPERALQDILFNAVMTRRLSVRDAEEAVIHWKTESLASSLPSSLDGAPRSRGPQCPCAQARVHQAGHPAASGERRAQGVHFRDRPRGADHASLRIRRTACGTPEPSGALGGAFRSQTGMSFNQRISMSDVSPVLLTPDVVGGLAGRRVLVVGDIMLDAYLIGDADRISPEAPVPVVRIEKERYLLGGAGNVARNIVALGGVATLVGVVGKDASADRIRGLARDEGICGSFVALPQRPTTVKTRVMARRQQMLRLDSEDASPLSSGDQEALLSVIAEQLPAHDVVILSDYSKGIVSLSFMSRLRGLLAAGPHQVKVLIDPKPGNVGLYGGSFLLTPNTKETGECAGMPVRNREEILAAGRAILEKVGCPHLLTTLVRTAWRCSPAPPMFGMSPQWRRTFLT